MAQILELSDWELKITMLDMLRALMGKVGNKSYHVGNVRREIETLIKNQKEMLEIKKK